jgi:hypothetical protein
MARQSPTNPRFRCNVCKDYYSAPKYKVHYQCASHGYLCEEHIYKTIYILYQMKNDFEEEFYIIVEREEINSVLEEIKRWNDRSDWCFIIDSLTEVTDKITISNLLNKCLCWKDPKKNLGKDYLPSEHLMFEGGYPTHVAGNGAISTISTYLCLNIPIKFNWHEDVGRWIEEGLEEEKAKAKPSLII